MRNEQGQFVEGHRANPETEFNKGEHWRKRKPFWRKGWLAWQYWILGKTCSEIADEWNVGDTAIHYWMEKHDIPTRTISETRRIKDWSMSGEDNGMYGKNGADNPHWKGGVTAERQRFYESQSWKRVSRKVWNRDGAECQLCGVGDTNATLHIHHIIPFPHKPTRAKLNNLVLLCEHCHYWVHSNNNEEDTLIRRLDE